MSILRQINTEVLNFKTKLVQVVPGLTFNQYENIQQIYFYFNSKFKTGQTDDEGDRKYFYNVNRNPCKIFTKAVDFDTKDIRTLTAGGGDPNKTWFIERDIKYWMRDKQFGKVLNRIFRELPVFGSVVLKVVNGSVYFVDLRNFVIDQAADTLESSNSLIEIHNYTVGEFRSIAKEMKWDQSLVDQVIEEFHTMKTAGNPSHIRLYERYGEVEEKDAKGNKTYPYKRVFLADVGVDQYDQYNNLVVSHPGVELASEVWDGNPYWEFHVEKIPGRWQGCGVVETLFEPQIRHNEMVNLQAKASYWAALRLFQTRDPAVSRNILNGATNGEVLNVDQDITQVDMSDRNLAFFNEETQKWNKNIDDLTIAFAPVGHSVIAIQIAQDQVVSYFRQIQQDIALDVKEMLYEVILPQFEKESNAEHTIRLVGKDLDTYIDMVTNDMVMKEVIRQALTPGKPFPTNKDRDAISIAISQSIKQGKEVILTVPKGFYTDAKYDIDIDIMGESVDTKAKYATRFAILQAITADPSMLTDPVKKNILYGMAEDGGLDPADIFGSTTPKLENMLPQVSPLGPGARAGGGVSAPMSGTDMAGMSKTTV